MKRLANIITVIPIFFRALTVMVIAGLYVGFAQQPQQVDPFLERVNELSALLSSDAGSRYEGPSDADLVKWRAILELFRHNRFDTCSVMLAEYNYTLSQIRVRGELYDVIQEKRPIVHGWGTFFYNRNYKKRLDVHIPHPVEDHNTLLLGSELFRKEQARWMLVAGPGRISPDGKSAVDIARAKRTLFQRWHEMVADLTHIAISIHGYSAKNFPGSDALRRSDIVLSNGRTSDDQWGISQISLAFRDTLRAMGFKASLAMLDSGFARLAAGHNQQGIFSNDSTGFGHWINVELSSKVRSTPSMTHRFIDATGRALDVTSKKIADQVNHAFGLVSPRVVKVDSKRGLLFPPVQAETYRIISFAADKTDRDTLDIRLGNWVEFLDGEKSRVSITRLDTGLTNYVNDYLVQNRDEISSVGTIRGRGVTRGRKSHVKSEVSNEPIQVHRIPLHPVASTIVTSTTPTTIPVFQWEGVVPKSAVQTTFVYGNQEPHAISNESSLSFLIPLLKSSFHTGRSKFVGVQMTDMLVKEIARLVVEHQVDSRDVGLVAEQADNGQYYLRIFPGTRSSLAAGEVMQ